MNLAFQVWKSKSALGELNKTGAVRAKKRIRPFYLSAPTFIQLTPAYRAKWTKLSPVRLTRECSIKAPNWNRS